MSAPANLARSQFCVAYPECKASEFVNYLFSPMGASEWPYGESEASRDPMIREEADAVGMPLVPAGVSFVPRTPDIAKGKQLVITFDDERNIIIVMGFLDPAQEPDLVREFPIEKVAPAPGVREIFEANSEMGISYRSF